MLIYQRHLVAMTVFQISCNDQGPVINSKLIKIKDFQILLVVPENSVYKQIVASALYIVYIDTF